MTTAGTRQTSAPLLASRDPSTLDVSLAGSSPIELIVAEIGEGAQLVECRMGPKALLDAGLVHTLAASGRAVHLGETIVDEGDQTQQGEPRRGTTKMDAVHAFMPRLAEATLRASGTHHFPVVLGGDHSCAVGTWSGVAHAHRAAGRIGLIWIDAHLDSHTPETSNSQAPHGMPLAALLGHGTETLTDLFGWRGKLLPQHAVVVGARSYEAGEVALLERLGVRVFGMTEVATRGLEVCLQEAVAIVSKGTVGYGVSFDVDAIDPRDAPGVGSPAAQGIRAQAAVTGLRRFAHDPRLLAFELVEYNPVRDDAVRRTAQLCLSLLSAVLTSPVAHLAAESQAVSDAA